jgi:uncharacterized protein YgbK (DUF1537 family)
VGTPETARALAKALAAGGAAVLATAPGGALPPQQVAVKLARVAAAVLEALWREEIPPAGLFLTGGETARATCAALGCTRLWLDGDLEPGIPLSRMADGRCAGLRVVTKAGGFGGPQSLYHALEVLSQ